MADLTVDREARGGSLLQIPSEKRRGLSPTRSRSRSRSQQIAPRSRSGSPLPFLMKDDREKSPFEIGETKAMLRAAPKAVFDKALVMDISPSVAKKGDEEIIYITTDMSVIDKALVMDVSSVTLIVLEDEDEEDELESVISNEEIPEADKLDEDIEGIEGEAKVKKVKKVVKKKKKKVVAKDKKEKTPPLKLDIKGPKKNLKGMFDKPTIVEEPPKEKKPMSAKKMEKLKMIEQMKADAKAKAEAEAAEKKRKDDEKQKKLEDRQAKMKPKEEEGGLMAVLAQQRKKQDDAKKKLNGTGDRKTSSDVELIDFKSGLRKVSNAESNASGSGSNEENGTNDDVEITLRPIKHESMNFGSDNEDSDNEREKQNNENGDVGGHSGSDSEPLSELSEDEADHMEQLRNFEKRESRGGENPTDSVTAELEKTFFVARKQSKSKPKSGEKWKEVKDEEEAPVEVKKPAVKSATEKEKDAEFQRQREAVRPPAFETFLKDSTAREYECLKLTCNVSGPDLNIKWYKNGNIVEKSNRIKIRISESLLVLEIPSAEIADSGQYSCLIRNKNGSESSKCTVEVYKEVLDKPLAPTFTTIRDFYHSHDDELIIECHIRGEPKPVSDWFKDGMQIFPNMRYKTDIFDTGYHRLTICKPLQSDSGKYVVKATNSVKRTEMAHEINFSGRESHLHVYGIYHSDPKKVHEMDTIRKAHEETMNIIAHVGSKEGKEGKGGKSTKSYTELVNPKNNLYWGSVLRDRTSLEGSRVKLVCSVNGPDPQMRWLKNDVPIVFGSKIRNGTRDGLGCIEIMSATVEDYGDFKCVAKNGNSDISTTCKLMIYSKTPKNTENMSPTFVIGLRDVYHTQENDLIIECKVRGVPPPKISWLRDNADIDLDDRVQQIDHHDGVCQLIINRPTRRDSGLYICRAENSSGSEKAQHRVDIELEQKKPVVMTQTSVVEQTNGTVEAPADVEETPADGEAPAAAASKGKGGKGKKGGGGGGRARPHEQIVSVKSKLVVTAQLTNRTVGARNRVKLSCCVQGPEPQMKWLRDGNPVVVSTKIRNMSRDGLGILEFLSPTIEDSGEYVCIARNPFSEVSTSCRLVVYDTNISIDAAPTFTRSIKESYHLNTNELILECHVRGEPKPKISWSKDSFDIEAGDKYQQIDHDDGTCELVINRPKATDSGKYICLAENRVKRVETLHIVVFEGKAHHIADNIHRAYHIENHVAKLREQEEGGAKERVVEEEGADPEGKAKKGKKGEGGGRRRGGGAPVPISNISFSAHLTDRVVPEGTKVKLQACINGPDPQIRWFKNDGPVVMGPKIKNLSRDGLGCLEFSSPTVDDSGEYRCVAKNATGECSSLARLTIYKINNSTDVPPTFTRPIKDTYHPAINELVLEAHVRGAPKPEVHWVRDAQTVTNSEKYHIMNHEDGTCELVINSPVSNDSGKYICVAKNSVKTEEYTHIVEFEAKPRIHYEAKAAAAVVAEVEPEVDIKTEIEEAPEAEAADAAADAEKPAAGKKSGKKGKKEGGGGGRRHGGQAPPDPKQNLHFVAHLANRCVAVGSRIKMTCYVEGPEPQVKFLKNGNACPFSQKIKNVSRENIAGIEFMSVTMEDAAEYTCIAKNAASEVSTKGTLTVYPKVTAELNPPTFTRAIKDSYNVNTKQLLIECHVTGDPVPIISWLKDGNRLLPSDKYVMIEEADGAKKLIVHNPNISDGGKYICRAENAVNKEELSRYVYLDNEVLGIVDDTIERMKKKREAQRLLETATTTETQQKAPSKPDKRNRIAIESALKDVTVEDGYPIKFVCSVRGENPETQWYKGRTMLDDDSARYRMSNRNGIISLEILNACASDSGEYRCEIRNVLNEVTTSAKLKVMESREIPPTFTRNLKDSYNKKTNQITIETGIEGRPVPKIKWFKDSEEISCNRHEQIIENGVCKLIINNPNLMDSGYYVCRAEHDGLVDEVSTFIRHIEDSEVETTYDAHMNMSTSVYQPRRDPERISRFTSRINRKPSRDGTPNRSLTRDRSRSLTNGHSRTPERYYREENRYSTSHLRPKFSTYLTDRLSTEGSTTKLTCNVLGKISTLTWFRNNIPVPSTAKYRMQCIDGLATLEIFNAVPADSGNYTCVVRNEHGESVTSSKLKVYHGFESMPLPPIFTRSIRDTYYIQEDELVLECRVRGEPTPEVTWLKDNLALLADERYRQYNQTDGYCKLVIASPTPADNGIYTCVAANKVHTEKILHTVEFTGKDNHIQERVHGFFHRDPNKPHFSNLLTDHTVPVGGTVALQAEVHGQVTIEWLKGKEEIVISEADERIKTYTDQGVYTLMIEKVTPEETGAYTCRALNAFGKAETTANVDIVPAVIKGGKPALFLSRPETEMAFTSDDDISMSFRVQGEPKPKISWLKGLRDITKSTRTLKEMSDDYTRFSLKRASYSDSGTYCIIARNNHGTDRAFVTVSVKQRLKSLISPSSSYWSQQYNYQPIEVDVAEVSYFKNPPGPIPSEPIVIDTGKNHVCLSWSKPHFIPNSAPVLAYRVEAWMVGKDGGARWRELGVTPLNSFDAFNLKTDAEYHFRVTPRNRHGWGESTQTSFPIMVGATVQLPEFTKILPGQMKALIDNEVVLECHVKGYPRPEITWYKDSVELDPDNRMSILVLGPICRLIIKNSTEADAGRYTCEAVNHQGRVSTFARLQIVTDAKIFEAYSHLKKFVDGEISEFGDMIPQFTMRLRDRRIQVTYPVRLTCQAIGWPAPEVKWYKNGTEIIENDYYSMWTEDNFYTLEIAKTSLEDYGKYKAKAFNALGSVSCYCTLIVDKGIRGYIAPEFYCGLDPLYVFKQGTDIRISAQVEAYPSVGVTWHRDGIRLRPSRRIIANLDLDGFVELVIADATKLDCGVYTCVASNAVGRVESSTKIIIDEAASDANGQTVPSASAQNELYSKEPMFITKPRSSEAFEGDTVIIVCEVVGDPKPDVVWLRDFLKPDYYIDAPHFRRVGDGPQYCLEIPRAKLDYTGTYSVIAKNCHGEAKAIISLQIIAKEYDKDNMEPTNGGYSVKHGNVETLPVFKSPLKDLRCCDGDSVTLECHVEGQPEPNIFWEKDGQKITPSNDFNAEFDGEIAQLSINRIFPEDEGEYTCIASNNIGRVCTSACIVVDVPEEKENLLSRQLARPPGLHSANSTPRSTPRSTPLRSLSPMPYVYRCTHIDIDRKHKSMAPKFLSIPHNRVVEEGETVRFQCTIGGHPLPWSTWDKNGSIITPSSRMFIKEKDDYRTLEIEHVTQEDAGLYRITLENDFGRIEATARLDIITIRGNNTREKLRTAHSASPSRRNPSMSRRLMGNSTQIGGRLALSCAYRGTSTPAKKFYHNGAEVVESDRVTIAADDKSAELIIENAQLSDQGEYTCVVETNDGIASTSAFVNIYECEEDIPKMCPEFSKVLEPQINAKEGSALDLICQVDSCAPYDFKWMRGGAMICDTNDFRYIDHGYGVIGLQINDPFVYDSGSYTCVVTSLYGKCRTTCDVYIMELTRADMTYVPEFIKCPLPLVSLHGSVVSFACSIEPPEANVVWSVCGREVTDKSRSYSIERQSDGYTILHILGTEHKHSGEIKCTSFLESNPINSVTRYTELTVLPVEQTERILELDAGTEQPDIPAYITRGPEDCTVLIGGTVALDIQFGGYPQPDVKWMRAGRAITECDTIEIHTGDGHSRLLLTEITADQSGKYTVEVTNSYNMDMAAASVAVEGVPDPPGGKPSVSKGPDRVAIAWCGPPYDGGCMVTGFILEMQHNDDEWQEIASVVDSLAYTVKNLSYGSKYQFRVRAENVHGLSEPSQPSDEIIHEKPCENVKSVDIHIRPGGEFRSRFDILEELGKGRFGIVHKVVDRDSGQTCAAKIIKCIKAKDRTKVQEEISLMQALKHPKLLQLAAAFESAREIVMVMEYITGGELFERVVADDFTLTEKDCVLFMRQICEGVEYMHQKSIVHLDLKPENIMCHTRTSHQIKIIDFGLAQKLAPNTPVRVLFGTPEFIPPEIINYEPIGFQSDMWSVGVICYVLLSGLSPFMGDSDVDTFANITRADYDFDDEAFDSVTVEAKDFISSLLIHRKESRLTASACMQAPWLAQENDNLSCVTICTDKLKKFIIRRKWQMRVIGQPRPPPLDTRERQYG